MTHSPGPWKVGNELEIYSSDGHVLAELRWGVPDHEVKGNLPLILAAPELLAALLVAVKYLQPAYIYNETAPLIKARMAIAKARGEQ